MVRRLGISLAAFVAIIIVIYLTGVTSLLLTGSTSSPATTSTTTASASPPVEMRIPKIGVDAQVVHLSLNADGSMPAPDGPYVVAWYTYSAKAGGSGNGVYSGHVDWHTGVTGVFWDLHLLQPGDLIYVKGQNGREYAYKVTSSTEYANGEAPVAQITGPKPGKVITLITCEGVFNQATHNYDHRRVVVAQLAQPPS